MSTATGPAVDWRALWRSGDLARFCFVSLGILLHATNETMIATIMPALVADLAGVQLVGWSFAIYELGAIVAGAAAGRMVSYVTLRANMAGAAAIYGVGALGCALAPSMELFLAGRLVEGLGGGALVSLALSRWSGCSRVSSGCTCSPSCRRCGASPPSAARCSARC